MALDFVECNARDDKNTATKGAGTGAINGLGGVAEIDFDDVLPEPELVTALIRAIEIAEELGWRI